MHSPGEMGGPEEGKWQAQGRALPVLAGQPLGALASGRTDPAAARSNPARERRRRDPGTAMNARSRAGPAPAPNGLPCVPGPRRRAALQTGLDTVAAMLQARCSWATSSDPAVDWNTGAQRGGRRNTPALDASLLALSTADITWAVPGAGRGLPSPSCCYWWSTSWLSAWQVRLWGGSGA